MGTKKSVRKEKEKKNAATTQKSPATVPSTPIPSPPGRRHRRLPATVLQPPVLPLLYHFYSTFARLSSECEPMRQVEVTARLSFAGSLLPLRPDLATLLGILRARPSGRAPRSEHCSWEMRSAVCHGRRNVEARVTAADTESASSPWMWIRPHDLAARSGST